MKCHFPDRDKLIEDYVMGTITEDRKKIFDEHCFNCEPCFQEIRLREEAVTLIRNEANILFANYLNKEKVQQDFFPLEKLNRLLWSPLRKQIAYAAASVLILLISIGAFMLIQNQQASDSLHLTFDNDVPYQYNISSLRGKSSSLADDPMLSLFINNFYKGMSDYLICEYESAIDMFDKLQSTNFQLEKNETNQEAVSWVRELYFYDGLSHLALSTSDDDNETKTQHANEAVYNLNQANLIASTHHLEHNDRELYFLGLAYALKGNSKLAINVLSQVKPDDDFYNRSYNLIRRLMK